MSMQRVAFFLLLLASPCASASVRNPLQANAAPKLVQTTLGNGDHPVERLMSVLRSLEETLESDIEDDKETNEKMTDWCKENKDEKTESIKKGTSKVKQLEATIEGLASKSASLKSEIEEAEARLKANREDLAEAEAQHEKESEASRKDDMERTQSIQQLKAAVRILGKHHKTAFPQLDVTLLQIASDFGRDSDVDRSFDRFLSGHGFDDVALSDVASDTAKAPTGEPAPVTVSHSATTGEDSHLFLPPAANLERTSTGLVQGADSAGYVSDWTSDEVHVVQAAISLSQAKTGDKYVPEYEAQSGEVLGMLEQLLENMEAEATKAERESLGSVQAFQALRTAKKEEIQAAETMAESKEDTLAQTDIDLNEAKEDLKETRKVLAEDEKFLASVRKQCKEAKTSYEKRSEARNEELSAVVDTIKILSDPEFKKATTKAAGASSFLLQISSVASHHASNKIRRAAARVLRRTAIKGGGSSEELTELASRTEIDAFTEVKSAINVLINTLKKQMADEVKKNDWCKAELQTNQVDMMKEVDRKKRLIAEENELGNKIDRLSTELADIERKIKNVQVSLQKISVSRMEGDRAYQATMSDQLLTVAVLKKAYSRFSEFYAKKNFAQMEQRGIDAHEKAKSRNDHGDEPASPTQKTYKKSSAGSGLLVLLKKLVTDGEDLIKESRQAEMEALSTYQEITTDTFATLAELQQSATSKNKAKAEARHDLMETKKDKALSEKRIDKFAMEETDLHTDCDFLLKNFDARQDARGSEMEGLQQALTILNGAAA